MVIIWLSFLILAVSAVMVTVSGIRAHRELNADRRRIMITDYGIEMRRKIKPSQSNIAATYFALEADFRKLDEPGLADWMNLLGNEIKLIDEAARGAVSDRDLDLAFNEGVAQAEREMTIAEERKRDIAKVKLERARSIAAVREERSHNGTQRLGEIGAWRLHVGSCTKCGRMDAWDGMCMNCEITTASEDTRERIRQALGVPGPLC